MSRRRYNDNVYSLSALSKKAGVGRILTWRRIVTRSEFAKLFKIVHKTQRGFYVETDLSTEGLIGIYKKHLDYVSKENKVFSKKAAAVRIENAIKRQSEPSII